MKTDYKFWYVQRMDDVHISEVAVRLYEGDVTTLDEEDTDGNLVPVTRYRRTKKLKKVDTPHFVDRKVKLDSGGNETLIFTDADFGVISTDDELRTFLNKELKKDKARTPIAEQEDNDQQ